MPTIRVMHKKPSQPPVETTIDGTLESLQKLVDGSIEGIGVPGRNWYIYCNDNGKSQNPVEPNFLLTNSKNQPVDVVAGTVVFVGLPDSEGEETSLTDEMCADIRRWLKGRDWTHLNEETQQIVLRFLTGFL